MKDVVIEYLEQYLSSITGFSDVLFYRGVNDIRYPLIPPAGRFGIEDEKTQIQFERTCLTNLSERHPYT